MAMTQAAPLVVIQLTDTHLFADAEQQLVGIPTAKSLQMVLKEVQALHPKPDLLLLTGDLSQDETLESYHRLVQLVCPLNIPTYWLPGNHDRVPLMQEGLPDHVVAQHVRVDQGGWTLLLLNSAVPNAVYGEFSSECLNWLDEQLQAVEHQPVLIAFHHPPVPIGSAWMDAISLRHAEALITRLERSPQVKLVLFGHAHQAFESEKQGIHYLGSPSTCVQFKPNQSEFAVDDQNPGFRILYLYPDGRFDTQVKRVNCAHQLDLAASGY